MRTSGPNNRTGCWDEAFLNVIIHRVKPLTLCTRHGANGHLRRFILTAKPASENRLFERQFVSRLKAVIPWSIPPQRAIRAGSAVSGIDPRLNLT